MTKSILASIAIIIIITVSISMAEFYIGVGTHVFEQNIDNNINIINKLRLNSLRDEINWKGVEKDKGQYSIPKTLSIYFNKAIISGVSPLVIFDYGNNLYDSGGKPVTREGIDAFVTFAKFSAKELSGLGSHFEIWNEWDMGVAPQSADSYYELVKATAPAIRAANCNAVILAGAATSQAMRSGWVTKLIELGVLKYVDGISIHPYVHCERDAKPEAWFGYINDFYRKLQKANADREVPLYITEMGWPSHKGTCATPQEKVAQYLARALLLVRTLPAVKGFWWYDLKDDGIKMEEMEHNFGLLGFDYAPKAALYSLRDIAPVIIKGMHFEKLQAPYGLVIISMIDGSGNNNMAIWTESGNNAKIEVNITSNNRYIPQIYKIGSVIKQNPVSLQSGTFITIDGMPTIISGIEKFNITKVVW